MPCYPLPSDNPHCQCASNPMAAFFCAAGHMLECHYPYDCKQAGCSHLGKYDLSPDEVHQAEQLAVERLGRGELFPYRVDDAGCVIVDQ